MLFQLHKCLYRVAQKVISRRIISIDEIVLKSTTEPYYYVILQCNRRKCLLLLLSVNILYVKPLTNVVEAASEMTYIVWGGALNSTHSLTRCDIQWRLYQQNLGGTALR